MKSIEKKLKQSSYESIFVSCVTIFLGVIMILFSNSVTNILSYLLGIILVINGLFKIYYYVMYEGKYNVFNYDLSFGILYIILGIICIIFKTELQSVFRIIIGVSVVYEGILNISLANKILFVDKPSGFLSLLLSVLMIICGGFIITTKGIVVTTIGYILIVFAIMNIIESIIFNRNLSKLKKYLSEFYEYDI